MEEVLAISRRRFDKTPSVDDMLKAGMAAGCEVDALRAELLLQFHCSPNPFSTMLQQHELINSKVRIKI
ncbi:MULTISPECIES: hypothetical protein [unclassified Cupriavidus]|uniref:hypothetical protein n=1 Tax=unclassified Cupriavidus TaxID=2640874 RepID=UPI001C002B44|nr:MULTISPECIES: hypothetical protein [unclassified Cupriavidus]MCA3183272.1 hypothetical protein [Cupriavidus sp.]MCA3191966.1 hypothetical protein [Cupriavidus sp.]MCA3197711.1 hypothetical protein [Cupriavidus sp.]MCA3202763.1 hypothetical protein [Cupriavidus sp.]MCA3207933.1 hypothetical protein [Cupriavidus sp.]